MRITIIGLGYVGLPLAVEFAKQYPTVGFDIDDSRVKELINGQDRTLEVEDEDLKNVVESHFSTIVKNGRGLYCTADESDIESSNVYIVTVPTPTDKNKRPVLTPLIKASESVGKVLTNGDYVIYESTVYPGVTEDECVPVLEQTSGLRLNKDFFVGYSPERINPGDKERSVTKILKVTSGSTPKAAKFIDNLYKSVIKAGTHLAPTIKIAEAAKVIENSQRDINIAFVNELAKIFNKLGIDTHSVLEAAGTKWNFLPFRPGLVGGHCIGVDPYYLAQKAEESGYYPEIILAGRRINDSMGGFVASEAVKALNRANIPVKNTKALILGFTFKENCPDTRNTRVIDIYNELFEFGLQLSVYDPWVSKEARDKSLNWEEDITDENLAQFPLIIVAVAHEDFKEFTFSKITNDQVIFDLKNIYPISKGFKRL